MWWIILLLVVENLGPILLAVVGLLSIGFILKNIEIACIVLGIISFICCSMCYARITEDRFDKKFIGILFAIVEHVFFFVSLGLCGWLFLILLIIDFCALYTCVGESDGVNILFVILSFIIPAAIILIN